MNVSSVPTTARTMKRGGRGAAMTQDEECLKRIAQLEEENDQLRSAADAFGQLAERLNTELRAERRAGTNRRHSARSASDRGQDSSVY